MKAIVKSKAAKGLRLEDVPEPETGINDVLIKNDLLKLTKTRTMNSKIIPEKNLINF